MSEYLLNGNPLSENQLQFKADSINMGVDQYIERYGITKVESDDDFEVKGGLWETGKQYIESITSGYETGRTVEENLEVFKGSTSLDDIEAMIKAGDALNNLPQNDRMKRFQKKVKDNGGGFFSTLWALVGEDPVLASQIAAQSMSMMAGALVDSGADVMQGKTGDTLGYVAAGSGIGAATFGTLGSVVPGLGNLIGAGGGSIAGALGGLSTAMENGLTFAEMLKEDMTEAGLNWDKEEIQKYLQDGDNYNRIKGKALGRGLTIGAVDLLSGGFAGVVTKNVGKNVLKASQVVRKGQKVAAGIATEGAFGGVGERLGQIAGGQEYDAGEIVMEAFASTPGSLVTSIPSVANITKKGVYKMNGETVTEQQMKEATKDMSDLDIAKADIEIENDDDYAKVLYDKQNKAVLNTLIDPSVTDQKDRDSLIELEIKRRQALSDTKKEGINKVPNAKENLDGIELEIETIINKYDGAQSTETLLQDTESGAFQAMEAQGKRSLKGTIEFARKAGEALGIEYIDAGEDSSSFLQKYKDLVGTLNASQEDTISDEELIKNSDGLIIKGEKGSAIIINKERAARTGAVSVGSHEILHAVLGDHLGKLKDVDRKNLITDFRSQLEKNLDSKSFKAINDRLNFYKDEYSKAGLDFDIDTTDEWFTALSDSIVKGEVKYSESFGKTLKTILTKLLQATPFKIIEFETGQQAFDFIKEYSENAKKGTLIAGAAKFAGKNKAKGSSLSLTQQDKVFTPQTPEEMAKDVNDIYYADTSEDKNTAGFEIAMKYEGQANTIFQRYLDTANLSQDQIDVLNKNKEDIISMLLYDKIPSQKADSKQRTVLGLVKDFVTEKQKYKNVAAYVNTFFKERAKEVFKYFLPDAFVKSTTDEAVGKKIDKVESDRTATEITDKEDARPTAKVDRQRDLKQLSEVKIDSKEQFIQDLKEDILQVIELNPEDVNSAIQQLIKGGLSKKVMDMMGVVSKKTGVSDQYKSFHDINFPFIQKSIPTAEIKKRYGKLFQIINTGKRDATPQGNPIFKISPIPKAQFGAYFTVGKEGTLIERKRSLAEVLIKGLITKATNDLIIENSTNNDAVFKATLENVLSEFDKQRGEFAKADAVSLSISRNQDIGFIERLALQANEKGSAWYAKNRERFAAIKPRLVAVVDDLVIANPDLFEGPNGFIPYMKNRITDNLLVPLQKGLLQWKSKKTGENTTLQKAYRETVNAVKQYIPIDILNIIGADFLGYNTGRALPSGLRKEKLNSEYVETGEKKDNSSPAIVKAYNEFMLLKEHFKKQVKTESWFKDKVWNNILSKNLTLTQRVNAIKEITNDLRLSAKASMALLKYLTLKLEILHKNKIISDQHLFVLGQLQTNIVFGFRALSRVVGFYMVEGKMVGDFAPKAVTKDTKAVKDLVKQDTRNITNEEKLKDALLIERQSARQEYLDSWKDTTEYKERLKVNKGDIEKTVYDLQIKNEHMGPNSITMGKMVEAIIHGDINSISDVENIWKDHATLWAPNYISDAIDDAGKKTSQEGLDRGKFAPKGKRKNLYGINGESLVSGRAKEKLSVSLSITEQDVTNHNIHQKALKESAKNKKPKGISIWDFDDTLAFTNSKIKYVTQDGKKGSLNAEEYAKNYVELADKGYTFDFSEFNKVVDGKKGPLFDKALARAKKFGTKDQFILTARPAESRAAIFEFLKGVGLNIPIENITGLANSTPEAKALWITEKVAEGYNDIYFADDALQNVQVVQDVLNQFDIKSDVQLAENKTKLSLSQDLNDIIQENEGIDANSKFSRAEGQVRGREKVRGIGDRFLNTPGSNDFMGLMYSIAKGKGKKGDAQIAWIEKNLYNPYKEGVQKINTVKQAVSNNFKLLQKSIPGINKKLRTLVDGTSFTKDAAVRVYLWEKAGFDIPGLSKTAKKKLVDAVLNDSELKEFADGLGVLSLQEKGYTKPGDNWTVETVLSDLDNISNKIGRKEYLQKFIENRELIFGKWQGGKLVGANMAKLEALYGPDYIEALNDMIWRMENGNSRPSGGNAQVNRWTNWITNSVGAIMFFNTRSALLQTLSMTNFVNWGDNNPFKAAAALANFPQFLKDFVEIFNSDFLQQRRGGLKLDVNEAALANSLVGQKNKVKAIIAYLLTKGFLPTQIADSFAIAAGGATFLRNRINTYVKQGMSKADAKTKAFQDMVDSSEPVQQSSDPSLVSKEQASILGRMILAFQNVTMQYSRRMKKSVIDLAKGRGDFKTNISRILYYGFVQNLVFNSLQSALFALSFDEDMEEEKKKNKTTRVANGMLDSILRGLGIPGAIVATGKNTIMEYMKQNKKGFTGDQAYTVLTFLNISPPIGSKTRKMYSAMQTERFNKKIIPNMSPWDISNPRYQSIGTGIEAFTNVPLGRAVSKANNIKQALNSDHENWQRVSMALGYNTWDVGVKDSEVLKVREETKGNSGKKSRKTKTSWGSSTSNNNKKPKTSWGQQ